MCWDIYMDAYHRRLQQAENISQLNLLATRHQWKMEWDLQKKVLAGKEVILVTDPAQVIRFATYNMVGMNGYQPEEVLGKTPKIFQGAGTQPEMRANIREAIIKRIPFKGTILNYRKDGTPYNCVVEEYPVWSKTGSLVHFIAFEKIA